MTFIRCLPSSSWKCRTAKRQTHFVFFLPVSEQLCLLSVTVSQIRACVLQSAHLRGSNVITLHQGLSHFTRTLQICPTLEVCTTSILQ